MGPPIGAWFQRRGEPGYRTAYAAFGILLPVVAGVLFFVRHLTTLLTLPTDNLRSTDPHDSVEEGQGLSGTSRANAEHDGPRAHGPCKTELGRQGLASGRAEVSSSETDELCGRPRSSGAAASEEAEVVRVGEGSRSLARSGRRWTRRPHSRLRTVPPPLHPRRQWTQGLERS